MPPRPVYMLRKTIYMPAKLWSDLEDAAEQYGVTLAEQVRMVLNTWNTNRIAGKEGRK